MAYSIGWIAYISQMPEKLYIMIGINDLFDGAEVNT